MSEYKGGIKMKKGRILKWNELESVADGETRVYVVFIKTGHEDSCFITKKCLEDAIYDVKNHHCEIYLSE